MPSAACAEARISTDRRGLLHTYFGAFGAHEAVQGIEGAKLHGGIAQSRNIAENSRDPPGALNPRIVVELHRRIVVYRDERFYRREIREHLVHGDVTQRGSLTVQSTAGEAFKRPQPNRWPATKTAAEPADYASSTRKLRRSYRVSPRRWRPSSWCCRTCNRLPES